MNMKGMISVIFFLSLFSASLSADSIENWRHSWPNTDFTKSSIDLSEILSGGPGKDGIPAIDDPKFVEISDNLGIADTEPVIGISISGEAKAYPLRVLMWHEIVNDKISGTPVAVTYCPLCNTSIVFYRRVDGALLDFGTTGNLRHSDLIMYDRQTETWWQQYGGEAIVGDFVGRSLKVIPSRLESFKNFKSRFPNGQVLVPSDPTARRYGSNPYVGYDRSSFPFLYKGIVPKGVAPMMRVVVVNDQAFSLPLLQKEKMIEREGLKISWFQGQSSALDTSKLAQGRDVGNIVVTLDGKDESYVVTFAFAFFAFHPGGQLLTLSGLIKGE